MGKIEVAGFCGHLRTRARTNEKCFNRRRQIVRGAQSKREQLFPESGEIFFRKGVEGRVLFRYAENGKIDALIDRRNNEDIVWPKVK